MDGQQAGPARQRAGMARWGLGRQGTPRRGLVRWYEIWLKLAEKHCFG